LKSNWQEVETRIVTNPDKPLLITVDRNGERIEKTLIPARRLQDDNGEGGMFPVVRTGTVVQRVQEGSPAEAAGIKVGDEIIRVKDVDIKKSGRTIQQTIQAVPEETFPITVLRGGEEVEIIVTPAMTDGQRRIGVEFPVPMVLIKLGFADAFKRSVQTNKQYAVLIFEVLGKLIKREASLKQLDGPIGIMRVSGEALNQGWPTLIMLMALISLNLGLLNMLPIPILDGGVMLLLIVESLMGRDLSLNVKERIVQVSFVFLLMLTVLVLYNDVVKWAGQAP